MIVKYKTILKGDKVEDDSCKGEIDDYKIIEYEYCCIDMEQWIKDDRDVFFNKTLWGHPDNKIVVYLRVDEVECEHYTEIKYCPFCGNQIFCEEVKRTKYKKILKNEYSFIEEEIKIK